MTIANEWNEQISAKEQKRLGEEMRSYLPYPIPVSTHPPGAGTQA